MPDYWQTTLGARQNIRSERIYASLGVRVAKEPGAPGSFAACLPLAAGHKACHAFGPEAVPRACLPPRLKPVEVPRARRPGLIGVHHRQTRAFESTHVAWSILSAAWT
jgi:hypothetical protein